MGLGEINKHTDKSQKAFTRPHSFDFIIQSTVLATKNPHFERGGELLISQKPYSLYLTIINSFGNCVKLLYPSFVISISSSIRTPPILGT